MDRSQLGFLLSSLLALIVGMLLAAAYIYFSGGV
jgi:hypothetical protein